MRRWLAVLAALVASAAWAGDGHRGIRGVGRLPAVGDPMVISPPGIVVDDAPVFSVPTKLGPPLRCETPGGDNADERCVNNTECQVGDQSLCDFLTPNLCECVTAGTGGTTPQKDTSWKMDFFQTGGTPSFYHSLNDFVLCLNRKDQCRSGVFDAPEYPSAVFNFETDFVTEQDAFGVGHNLWEWHWIISKDESSTGIRYMTANINPWLQSGAWTWNVGFGNHQEITPGIVIGNTSSVRPGFYVGADPESTPPDGSAALIIQRGTETAGAGYGAAVNNNSTATTNSSRPQRPGRIPFSTLEGSTQLLETDWLANPWGACTGADETGDTGNKCLIGSDCTNDCEKTDGICVDNTTGLDGNELCPAAQIGVQGDCAVGETCIDVQRFYTSSNTYVGTKSHAIFKDTLTGETAENFAMGWCAADENFTCHNDGDCTEQGAAGDCVHVNEGRVLSSITLFQGLLQLQPSAATIKPNADNDFSTFADTNVGETTIFDAQALALNGANLDMTTLTAFRFRTPAALSGGSIDIVRGYMVDDLQGRGTNSYPWWFASQTGCSGNAKCNFQVVGGDAQNGHLVFANDNHFLWDDAVSPGGQKFRSVEATTNNPAAGTGNPFAQHNDGSTTSGLVAWAAAGTSCTTACQATQADGCVDSIQLLVAAGPAGDELVADGNCTGTTSLRMCQCN